MKLCSVSPTIFEAFKVIVPIWEAKILGIIKELTDVFWSTSNLTLSLFVNSLPFKNHVILALGKASTKHSNLAKLSWMTIAFSGFVISFGDPVDKEKKLKVLQNMWSKKSNLIPNKLYMLNF